jgi:predicted nucleotidyltransferase
MSIRVNEAKILEIFFKDGKERHLREVARLARITPVSAGRYLKQFSKAGLLTSRSERNHTLFSPADTTAFRLEKRFWNVRRITQSGLLKHLDEQLAYPTVILFGSVAKGENGPHSDVDLFIISSEKKDITLEQFRSLFGAEIQVFLHTKKEFQQLCKTSPALINNVLNGVILSGYVEVFS